MPVPENISALNLTGQYVFDTKIGSSESVANFLSTAGAKDPQVHKAICSEANTMRINHFKDPSGLEHLEMRQTLGEGVPDFSVAYRFDWKEVNFTDPTFGPLVVQAHRISLADVDPKIRAKWEIIDSEDARKNGLVEVRFASGVEGSAPRAWDSQKYAVIVDTKLGKRLAWITKTLGPKGEILAEDVHYMDYVGPLKTIKGDE